MSDYSRSSISSGYNTTSSLNTELTKVETAIATKMDKSGTTMTGDLDMNSNEILNLSDAVDATSPVTLAQLQALVVAGSIQAKTILKTTATQDQVLFTAPTYVAANNSLEVFVNGQRQFVTDNYTETSTTSFTFNTVGDINAGDIIYAVVVTIA